MKAKKNIHIGSSFDSFLEEEGLETEVSARANKRTFVHQLEKKMVATKANKSRFRKALGSPTTTSRLFDESYTSLSLDTMTKAASVVGCDLKISLVPKKFAKS